MSDKIFIDGDFNDSYESRIRRMINNRITVQQAFDFGYDAGKNGANTTNCNFAIFSTPEKTKAWERGKKAGESSKLG